MKKLILIIDGEKSQFDSFEELVSFLFDKEELKYMELEESVKYRIRYEKAFANSFGKEKYIINLKEDLDNNKKLDLENFKNGFFIDNDYLYVLSLIKNQTIIVLEEKNANIFCNKIKKDSLDGNYIVVNNFVNELLLQYLNLLKEQ